MDSLKAINEQLEGLTSRVDELAEGRNDSDEISMHRKNRHSFCFFFSAFALIISIIAILTSLESFSPDSEAFLSVVVAALSVLVVVLLGWHFYNIIELKGYKEQINERIERKTRMFEKRYEKKMDSLILEKVNDRILKKAEQIAEETSTKINLAAYQSFEGLAFVNLEVGNYGLFIFNFVWAIFYGLSLDNESGSPMKKQIRILNEAIDKIDITKVTIVTLIVKCRI